MIERGRENGERGRKVIERGRYRSEREWEGEEWKTAGGSEKERGKAV